MTIYTSYNYKHVSSDLYLDKVREVGISFEVWLRAVCIIYTSTTASIINNTNHLPKNIYPYECVSLHDFQNVCKFYYYQILNKGLL